MTNKLIKRQIDTKSKQDKGITSSNGQYYVNPQEYNNILSRVNTSTPVNIDLPEVSVTATDPKNYRSAFHPEDIGTFTDTAMGPFSMFLPNIFKGTQAIINKDYKTIGNETLKTILPMNNIIGRMAGLTLGAYQLGNKEGIPKTYNYLKNKQYGRAALSGLGDVFNATMAGIGAKGLYGDLSNSYTKFMEGEVPQWLRNTSLWHNVTAEHRVNRAYKTVKDLRNQFTKNAKSEYDIADKIQKSPVFQHKVPESVTVSPHSIPVEKMKPETVKKAWAGIVNKNWSPYEVSIENINGKPTAVTSINGYSPTQVINGSPRVTTGEYNIPDFETGNIVKGNLQINGGTNQSLFTQYGDIINRANNPREVIGLTPLQGVLRDNYNYVQKDLPGFRGFGSSIGVMDGSLSHITHDIDGFMTKEAYDAARKVHPDITTPDSRGLASYFVKPEQYGNDINGANHIDINVIDVNPITGLGNSRATELYRQFFPQEYRQSIMNISQKSNDTSHIPIVHLNGTPFTNQELLNAYDPLKKTIMDSIESSKPKHIGRMMEYLAGPNPDAVHNAIQATADEIAQTNKGFTLPKLKFGTPEENVAILKKIGFTGDIATIAADPKKMQNTLDLWYIGEGGYFSRTAGAGDRGEIGGTINKLFRNFTDWNEKTDNSSNGHGAGAFLNAVFGNSKSVIGNSVYGVYHPKLQGIYEGMTPDELISTVRRQNGWSTEKVNREDLVKILKALRDNNLGKNADFIENTYKSGKGVTFSDILSQLPNYGLDVKNAGKQIHADTGINAIGGEYYGNNSNYAGLIGDFNPNIDIGFFGRDNFEGWPSWNSRNMTNDINLSKLPFSIMKNYKIAKKEGIPYQRPDYIKIPKEQLDKYVYKGFNNQELKDIVLKYINDTPNLPKDITIDEVMKLPEFKEHLLIYNPYIRRNYNGDYEYNIATLRSRLASKKYNEHLRKATDWATKSGNENIRIYQNLHKKSTQIHQAKDNAKINAINWGSLGAFSGAVLYGGNQLYNYHKKDNDLYNKWQSTPEGQKYAQKIAMLEKSHASDDEIDKAYEEDDEAFNKYKSSLNIQTHAKGGLLQKSKFNKNNKFESKYLNIEPKK